MYCCRSATLWAIAAPCTVTIQGRENASNATPTMEVTVSNSDVTASIDSTMNVPGINPVDLHAEDRGRCCYLAAATLLLLLRSYPAVTATLPPCCSCFTATLLNCYITKLLHCKTKTLLHC